MTGLLLGKSGAGTVGPQSPSGTLCPLPTTSYLFGVFSKAGTGLTTGWCGGEPAVCRTEGWWRGHPAKQVWTRSRLQAGLPAGPGWRLLCAGARVSALVALQREGSEGPKSFFKVYVTVVTEGGSRPPKR